MSDSVKTLPDILRQLKMLCDQGATGSLFIVSNQNHPFSFGINKGRIVSVQYRITFGMKAIPYIGAVQRGKTRFENNNVGRTQNDLPSNKEIVQAIIAAHKEAANARSGSPSNREPKPIAKGPQFSTSSPSLFRGEKREQLEAILIDALGPMGSLLCDSIAQNSDVSSVMEQLYQEVNEPELLDRLEGKIRKIAHA